MADRVKDMGANDPSLHDVFAAGGVREMQGASPFTITREIGIDMAHRVTMHASKCRNMHGHRYTIQATVGGHLVNGGAQDGMVMDFGFVKEVMMKEIDGYFDHGTCLWVNDPICQLIFDAGYERVRRVVMQEGFVWGDTNQVFGKVYILPVTPTAENLAAHWFHRMVEGLATDRRSAGAKMVSIRVWETPNCYVDYAG